MKITLENLIQIWKLIKPKFYNKITWLIVSFGLVLIAPPLWSVILNQFIEKHTDYKIIGDYDELIGIALIIIGLIYNVCSQWVSNYTAPENVIEDSTISNSNIVQGSGNNMTINNTFNIYIQDDESLRRVLETLNYGNQGSEINFVTGTNYTSQFINLIQSLPWTNNISEITFQNPNRTFYNIVYKTSCKIDGHFYVRLHDVESEDNELVLSNNLPLKEGGIPILESIFWNKYKVWTLNTIENFTSDSNSKTIGLENAFKNDLSVVLGDITFIIQDLVLELTYDSDSTDTSLPRHESYGHLIKSQLVINDKRIDLSPLEMAIIDSEINTQIIKERKENNLSVIQEKNVNTNIIKLSSLMIKVLAKFERDTSDETIELLRKSIIELMKKIKALHSYQIPVDFTNSSDYLYNEAFNESSVIKDYENQKRNSNK